MQIKRIFVSDFYKIIQVTNHGKEERRETPCETDDPIMTSAAEQEGRAKEAINVKYFV